VAFLPSGPAGSASPGLARVPRRRQPAGGLALHQPSPGSVALRAGEWSGFDAEAVRRLVVEDTSYRTRPKAADAASESGAKEPLQILILGEANICRSPIAEAMLRAELEAAGLAGVVGIASKAVQDYTVGEGVPEAVRTGLEALDVPLVAPEHVARKWRPEWDVVDYDLLLAVDRYVAADAMKEVSVWDTIQKEVEYCGKIRGLYEFNPKGTEIEDPLYGNTGGAEEQEALKRTVDELRPAVKGIAAALADAVSRSEGTTQAALRDGLAARIQDMGEFEWDAPPMLRKRSPPIELQQQMLDDGMLTLDE